MQYLLWAEPGHECEAGQIAHIDQDNTNNLQDNLVFLCLPHHHEYDSRTSQRKNITAGELKAYREELIADLGNALNVRVYFGDMQVLANDPYGGEYVRVDSEHNSATLMLTPIPDGVEERPRYAITGWAVWSSEPNPHFGPNIGSLGLIGEVAEGVISHAEYNPYCESEYSFFLTFERDGFVVEEFNANGRYGMNVNFDGIYRKAT